MEWGPWEGCGTHSINGTFKQKEIAKGKGVDKGITFSAIGDNWHC